ncbi:response regulator [Chloracidobacterium sp. MS 40/45]|uniref:response regulator transcription factor n=1 Tax=Chloracidobacterium aggregatum TaxID=2851959 RepID=UPI001B8B1FE4|nr:response regulator [Chloracidobacterium aggregatum]QUW01673.1 response regulator [Chloracidobacterium sp. MS 40/45]
MNLPYVSPAETSSLSSARILVVDDEPLIRQSIGQTLRKQGHQVALAADGRDALKQLGTATFELMICDISMPHMDGIELCRLVRSDPRTAATPFLFLSAYQDIETRLQGLSAGANDFLGKPFSLDELVYRVNRLLTHRRSPLVDEALEVNPNHLGQFSFEQALHVIRSQALSGLLTVIFSEGEVGRAVFEQGNLTAAEIEAANGDGVLTGSAALEYLLQSPRVTFTFSGQQTLDNAVLMTQITRTVESEAG